MHLPNYQLLRETYAADDYFTLRHVERLSDNETAADFESRLAATPSPSEAKGLADRVLNSFAERMRYAVRYGGQVVEAESGRGVDNFGASMSSFIKELARELVVAGRVGVFVDNVADLRTITDPSHPYCRLIRAEDITRVEVAPPGSPSMFSIVEFNSGKDEHTKLWIGEDNKVMAEVVSENEHTVFKLDLYMIPFVIVEHESLIARVAQHQITLTNLLSVMAAESPGLVTAFLARQRSGSPMGFHLRKIPDEVSIGRRHGLWYENGANQPAFVSPSPGPMGEARQLVAALVDDMERLAGLSGDTIEERAQNTANVVGSLGDTLYRAEKHIWQYISVFSQQPVPVVQYPATWLQQSEAERLADVEKLFAVAQKAPGRAGMAQGTVLAVEQLMAGMPSDRVQAAVDAVQAARCLLNDPVALIRAYEAKALDGLTIADSLGCLPEVAVAAKAEAEEKARQLAMAAAAVNHGSESVGSDRDAQLAEKEVSQQNGEVRGEGR